MSHRDTEQAVSLAGSDATSDIDRYGAEEESSIGGGSSIALSGRVSSSISTASTKVTRNTLENTPVSPSSSAASMSRNSLAASRLLRTRKDRGTRGRVASPNLFTNEEIAAVTTGSETTLSPGSRSETMSARRQIGAQRNAPTSPTMSPTAASQSIAASAATRRTLRNRVRQRVAGGAAAKLMLQGPRNEAGKGDDGEKYSLPVLPGDDNPRVATLASLELDEVRQKAQKEFSVGPETNSRYHSPTRAEGKEDDDRDRFLSEASLPSILNRSEVFHKNATAAVIALLQPRNKSVEANSLLSGGTPTLDDMGIQVTPGKHGIMVATEKPQGKAFQSPRTERENFSLIRGMSNVVDTSFEQLSKAATSPILSNSVEQTLEEMKTKMVTPSKTLADLLTNIASPSNPIQADRGYMVRRKNACGALKVLTANPENRRTMCWTVGVLPALTSVFNDTGSEGLKVAYPDPDTRLEYIEARKRSVAALLNLAMPKGNRIPIFHSPGLMQAIVKVINDDRGEGRQGCCAVLGFLAKTQENRLLLVQVPGLVDALANVIKHIGARLPTMIQASGSKYTWDSDFETAVNRDLNGSIASEGTDRITMETKFSGTRDDDSDLTPQMTTSPTSSKISVYDSDRNEHLHGARKNVFAVLLHVVKEKDNAYSLARHQDLVATLVGICKIHDTESHVHAIKILAHLTRHRGNSKVIVFQTKVVVPALVKGLSSKDNEARRFACYGLQNLSQDKPCRQEVASTQGLVMALCQRARQASDPEEKLAAISALKNLTDDPANLIPMTNTPECFATLMQIAHGHDKKISEEMQYLACDALATLSHWLRKIASSGTRNDISAVRASEMFVPSMKVVTWMQWQ